MCVSMDYYSNGLSVHEKLQSLNITISSDFGGIKDTTEQFFACLISFLACVVGLNIILTILMICPEVFYPKIVYPVFLSVVCIKQTYNYQSNLNSEMYFMFLYRQKRKKT